VVIMGVFKFVISDKGKSFQVERDQSDCSDLIELKIGDRFNGEIIGLNGYVFKITGGTDKDGFPMRPDLEGAVKKRLLLKESVGFQGRKRRRKELVKIKGLRKRKTVRGNTIDKTIVQVSCKVIKRGEKPLEEILSKKEETKEENKQ